jgi:hypothetical protein
MQRNHYGEVFLSPESAIQAVLDEFDLQDDLLAIDEADDFLGDDPASDDELVVQQFARHHLDD